MDPRLWPVSCQCGTEDHPTIGTKPIETIKPGDQVVSRDEKTGKTEFKTVVQTTVRTSFTLLKIALADAQTGEVVETLTSTPEHPYYKHGEGFIPANRLAIGNSIVTRAGPALIVKSITQLSRPAGFQVFNLTVEDDHTYLSARLRVGPGFIMVTKKRSRE